MSIDTSSFLEYCDDPRYDLLQKPLRVDKANRCYELQAIAPSTSKGTYSKTAALTAGNVDLSSACYNSDGTLHYIDITCGTDFKAFAQGCGVILKYHAVQARTGANGTAFAGVPIAPLTTAGWSIPWCTPGAFFTTVALKANNQQAPIEQYLNSGVFKHVCVSRALKKYRYEALEKNSMTFNTPCIESAFDTTVAMSQTSVDRGAWLGAAGVYNANSSAGLTTACYITKFIPLSDLFECCEVPAIWTNVNRLRFEFTLAMPDAIAFSAGATTNIGPNGVSSGVHVYVDDVKLFFDSSRMAPQSTIETAIDKQKGTVENLGFIENFAVPVSYSPGAQIVVSQQKDVQEVLLAFPALGTTVDGGTSTCTNPHQYHNGGLSSITVMYGADQPFRQPLTLSGLNGNGASALTMADTVAFALYKKSCGADLCRVVPLALDFLSWMRYHVYFLPIFNQTSIHRSEQARDLRIDSTGGVAGQAIVIVRKLSGAQIMSSGEVVRL